MILKHQVQTYLTGLDPKSLVINDFNRDSILDLAVIMMMIRLVYY